MKCNQVQEKLLHSIGKGLSPQIRDHLLGCEECERKHRILQETQKSLEDLGGAVRAGSVSMEAPPFLPIRRRSFWQEIRDKLETPVPVWVLFVIGVVGLLLFVVVIFSPPVRPPMLFLDGVFRSLFFYPIYQCFIGRWDVVDGCVVVAFPSELR